MSLNQDYIKRHQNRSNTRVPSMAIAQGSMKLSLAFTLTQAIDLPVNNHHPRTLLLNPIPQNHRRSEANPIGKPRETNRRL